MRLEELLSPPPVRKLTPTPLPPLNAHSAVHPFHKSSGKLGGSMESSPLVKVNYIAAHGAQSTKMQKSTCCGEAINCRDWKRKSTVLGIKWPKTGSETPHPPLSRVPKCPLIGLQ